MLRWSHVPFWNLTVAMVSMLWCIFQGCDMSMPRSNAAKFGFNIGFCEQICCQYGCLEVTTYVGTCACNLRHQIQNKKCHDYGNIWRIDSWQFTRAESTKTEFVVIPFSKVVVVANFRWTQNWSKTPIWCWLFWMNHWYKRDSRYHLRMTKQLWPWRAMGTQIGMPSRIVETMPSAMHPLPNRSGIFCSSWWISNADLSFGCRIEYILPMK